MSAIHAGYLLKRRETQSQNSTRRVQSKDLDMEHVAWIIDHDEKRYVSSGTRSTSSLLEEGKTPGTNSASRAVTLGVVHEAT
jgi:hemin uptake protein HemP